MFEFELSEVSRPAKARERYGEQRITSVKDTGVAKYHFEDDLIRVIIYAVYDRILFDLKNKTEHSIRIPWSEAAFVGVDGKSEAIMHIGVKYADCAGPKAPSIVVQNGRIEDNVIPCSRVNFASGRYASGWEVLPLGPSLFFTSADSAARVENARTVIVGQQIRLLLPIQVEDVTNDYLFTFVAKSVAVRRASYLEFRVP